MSDDTPGIVRAMGAGVVATVVMTALLWAAPLLNFSAADFLSTLEAIRGPRGADPEMLRLMGILWHLNFGIIVFPHIYVFALYRVLPGPPWARGLLFGAGIWLLLELVAMPMAGAGVFSWRLAEPVPALLGALGLHLVYGVILGAFAGGAQGALVKRGEVPQQRAA